MCHVRNANLASWVVYSSTRRGSCWIPTHFCRTVCVSVCVSVSLSHWGFGFSTRSLCFAHQWVAMFLQPSQIPNLQITPHNNSMKIDTERLRDRDKERGELVECRILSFVCILWRFFFFVSSVQVLLKELLLWWNVRSCCCCDCCHAPPIVRCFLGHRFCCF